MSGNGPQLALEDEESFEAIEQAVMETARGRWFLAEFAARSRRADTRALILSLAKFERAFASSSALSGAASVNEQIRRLENDIVRLTAVLTGVDGPDNAKVLSDSASETERQAMDLAIAADRTRDHLTLMKSGPSNRYSIEELDHDLTHLIGLASEQAGSARRFKALSEIMRHVRERLAVLANSTEDPPHGEPQIGPAANDEFPHHLVAEKTEPNDIVA